MTVPRSRSLGTDIRRPAGLPRGTLMALMLAVFTVSAGYGVVLPMLPYVLDDLLGAGATTAQVSRSTGLLTGAYMLALFLFEPLWGRISDRRGRRVVLLVGLIGYGATTVIYAFLAGVPALYSGRFLSGVFAAGVTPVALASVADLAPTEEARGQRLTLVSLAGISGFLLGPMLGAWIERSAGPQFSTISPWGPLAIPLIAAAGLAFVAALAIAVTLRATPAAGAAHPAGEDSPRREASMVTPLLALAFVVSAAVSVFEVGLALRGKEELRLSPTQIALMFSTCSLVMIVVQSLVFSPWVKPEKTRWLLVPALAVLAAGLFLAPRAASFTAMLVVVAAVAASAGILSPILTYWVSRHAGRSQGAELGKQAAVASLGAAVGSAAGGLLFKLSFLTGASFVVMAGVTALAAVLSFHMPRRLGKASKR